MANNENLIPLNKRCKEDAKKIRSAGGHARKASIKKQKELKEELLLLLANGDTQEKVSLALIQEALNGNVKAFEVIRDTIGQKPKEDIQAIVMPVINIKGL